MHLHLLLHLLLLLPPLNTISQVEGLYRSLLLPWGDVTPPTATEACSLKTPVRTTLVRVTHISSVSPLRLWPGWAGGMSGSLSRPRVNHMVPVSIGVAVQDAHEVPPEL